MKKLEIATKIVSLGLTAAIALTACGNGSAGSGTESSSSDVQQTVAATAEDEALAAELLDRNVTPSDVVTQKYILWLVGDLHLYYNYL